MSQKDLVAQRVQDILQTANSGVSPLVQLGHVFPDPNRHLTNPMKIEANQATSTISSVSSTDDDEDRGSDIWDSFKDFLYKTICTEYGYCKKKANFTDPLTALLDLIPGLDGQIPVAVSKILSGLLISAASWAAVAAYLIGQLITMGLDDFCDCSS